LAVECVQRTGSIALPAFAQVAFHCAPLRSTRKLVVSFEDRALSQFLAGFGAGTAALRLDTRDWEGASVSERKPVLPLDDASFDAAVACRVTRHAARIDMTALLGELLRVLHAPGSLLLLAHEDDFRFAPLPQSGQVRLLRRWLMNSGFGSVQFEPLTPAWILAVGSR
jgi:Methyltransferase domain